MSEENICPDAEKLDGTLAEMGGRRSESTTSITHDGDNGQEIGRAIDIHSALCSMLQCSHEDSINNILTHALQLILSIPWLAFESRGSIFLAENNDSKGLVMKVQAGLPEALRKHCRHVPPGTCLCGRAALTQKTQFAACLDERHEIEHEGMGPHGHYCVPIVYGGKTLGVINVYVRDGHRRDKREVEFLNAMANALAWTIEYQRTRTTLHEKESRLSKIMAGFEGFYYVSSNDYIIEFMNGKLIERTGHDATGEVCYKIMHRRNAPCPWCEKDRVLKGETTRWEMQDPRDNRWYYVVNAPLRWQTGSVARQSVILDISEIRQVEEALLESERLQRARTQELMESNAALKELTKQIEQERKAFEGRVLSDFRKLILPYIGKIRNSDKEADTAIYLDTLELNLKTVISSFSTEPSLGFADLTQKEKQIANLINEGKGSAEIAKILNMSRETIKSHRQNIRRKLGIKGGKANLKSFIALHLK